MQAWKTIAAFLGVTLLVLGILLGTGVIELAVFAPSGAGGSDDEMDPAKKKRRRGKKKGRRRGKKKGGAGPESDRVPGVTVREDAAEDGLVLYNLTGYAHEIRNAPPDLPVDEVRIVDLDGETLHTWKVTALRGDVKRPVHPAAGLKPNGHLVAIVDGKGLVELDWDGETVWTLPGAFHFTVTVDPKGFAYTVGKQQRTIEIDGEELTVGDESVVIVSPTGELVAERWLTSALKGDATLSRALERRGGGGKKAGLFHANSVEALREDPEGRWAEGDLLVAFRLLGTVAVLARDGSKVLWSLDVDDVQQVSWVAAAAPGKFLLFDNGRKRKWSRIMEIDVGANDVGWEFRATEPGEFFSGTRGAVQALQGGNVFVVGSNSGRLFEVTREGQVVWDYSVPDEHRGRAVPVRGQKIQGKVLAAVRKRLGLAGGDAEPEDAKAEDAKGDEKKGEDKKGEDKKGEDKKADDKKADDKKADDDPD